MGDRGERFWGAEKPGSREVKKSRSQEAEKPRSQEVVVRRGHIARHGVAHAEGYAGGRQQEVHTDRKLEAARLWGQDSNLHISWVTAKRISNFATPE